MKDILYINFNVGRLANKLWVLSSGLQYYDGTNKLYCNNVPNLIRLLFPDLKFYKYNNEETVNKIAGYCQDYNSTKETVLQKYCKFPKYLRNKKYPEDMTVIHVRRGDYLTVKKEHNENLYISLSPEYIKDTVDKYGFYKHIYVISDDIQWCKKNLTFLPSDTVFSKGNEIEDLYLLTIAKNIICSGSSYSIMGCVLNKRTDKLCIGIKPYWNGTPDWMSIYPDYFKIEDYTKYLNKVSMKKITIYYIATSSYTVFWDGFISTLDNLLPDYHKHVILITDALENVPEKYSDNITIERHYIDHYPWPIITLFKFYYMLKFPPQIDSDYVSYFNANCKFRKTELGDSWLNKDKVNLTYHFGCQWSHNLNSMKNQYDNSIPYCQGGLIVMPYKYYKPLCEWHYNRVQEYLKKNQIPPRHDETILNEWVSKNKDICVWYEYNNLVDL